MPVEKSAGAIIFRKEPFDTAQGKGDKIYYLLLHYPSAAKAKPRSRVNSLRGREYWDLPKGHIEKGEDILETVKREIFEETGLKDINFTGEFKETIKYFFKWEGKNIMKFVTFYLVETKTKEVKISEEHVGFQWLSYDDAMSRLTFKNAKNILQKANDYLNQKPSFHYRR